MVDNKSTSTRMILLSSVVIYIFFHICHLESFPIADKISHKYSQILGILESSESIKFLCNLIFQPGYRRTAYLW